MITNTPIQIQRAVIGIASEPRARVKTPIIQKLFSPLGLVVPLEEGEMLKSLMVACSSGVGFIYELMLYWQEWIEEHGFEAEIARKNGSGKFFGNFLVGPDL